MIEIRGQALQENPIVLKQQYVRSIDDSDKVILSTDDSGTPIILQTRSNSGGNTSSADAGFSANTTTNSTAGE